MAWFLMICLAALVLHRVLRAPAVVPPAPPVEALKPKAPAPKKKARR